MAAPSEARLTRRRSSSGAMSELLGATPEQSSPRRSSQPDNDMQKLINETMRISQADTDSDGELVPLRVSPPTTNTLAKQPPSYDMLNTAPTSPLSTAESATASPSKKLSRMRSSRLKAAYNNQRHHTPDASVRSFTGSITSLADLTTYTEEKLDAFQRIFAQLKNTNSVGIDVSALSVLITKLLSPDEHRERPLDEEHAKKVMRGLDGDADQCLNFDEFCRAMDLLLDDRGEPEAYNYSLLAADLYACLEDLDEARRAIAQQQQDFELEKDMLLRDMDVIKQQMQSREAELVEQAHAELNTCYDQITKLQGQLARFRSNNDLSRLSPAETESDVNRNALPDTRPGSPDAAIVSELEELKTQHSILVEDYERILGRHSGLEGRYDGVRLELEALGSTHANTLDTLAQQERTIAVLTDEIKSLQVELEDYKTRAPRVMERVRSFEPNTNMDLQAEIRLNELADENGQLQRELDVAKGQIRTLKQEQTRLKADLTKTPVAPAQPPQPISITHTVSKASQTTLHDASSLQLAEAQATISELRDEAVRRKAQLFQLDKEYSKRLEASQLEIDALRRQLHDSESANTSTTRESSEKLLRDEIASLLGELNQVKHRNLTLSQQLSRTQGALDNVQLALARERARTARLSEQLHTPPTKALTERVASHSHPNTPTQSLAEVLAEITEMRSLQRKTAQDHMQRLSDTNNTLKPPNSAQGSPVRSPSTPSRHQLITSPTREHGSSDRRPTLIAGYSRHKRVIASQDRTKRPPVVRLGSRSATPDISRTPSTTSIDSLGLYEAYAVDMCSSQAADRLGLVGSMQLILSQEGLALVNHTGVRLAKWPISLIEKLSSYGQVLAIYIWESPQKTTKQLLYAKTARAKEVLETFARLSGS